MGSPLWQAPCHTQTPLVREHSWAVLGMLHRNMHVLHDWDLIRHMLAQEATSCGERQWFL